jgi:uncharacterized protein (TIGR02270 family)
MSNVIVNVVSQHAEEAAMLWLLRHSAVDAPHYDLADLAKLDARVDAHIDGLRIAGHAGWETCLEQLSFEEEGEVFVAGFLALESGDKERLAKVLEIIEQQPQLVGAMVSALGWMDSGFSAPIIAEFLKSEKPSERQIGIAASAILCRDSGRVLLDATRSENGPLRSRALKALGELGKVDQVGSALEALDSEDADVQFAGAWSATLLTGSARASSVLQFIAESGSRRGDAAAMLAARRLAHSEVKVWQRRLAVDAEHRRLAIYVAGQLGDPDQIPWLIEQMTVPEQARVAGEAFTYITGVDIAYDDLDGEWPEGFEAGPTENPEDENVEMDADEDLPWPNPVLIQKWWSKNQGQCPKGTRYLQGKPMTAEWLKTVLRDGRQRQRAAAALELAIRQPGQPLFNVGAPGFRQQQILGKGEVIR